LSNLSFVCHLLAIQVCRLVLASSYFYLILSFLICRLVSSCATVIFVESGSGRELTPKNEKHATSGSFFVIFVTLFCHVCHVCLSFLCRFVFQFPFDWFVCQVWEPKKRNITKREWRKMTKPYKAQRQGNDTKTIKNTYWTTVIFCWLNFHDASHVDYGLLLAESSHTPIVPILPYNRYKQMTFRWHQDSIYSNDGPNCVSPEGMCNPTDVCNPSDSSAASSSLASWRTAAW